MPEKGHNQNWCDGDHADGDLAVELWDDEGYVGTVKVYAAKRPAQILHGGAQYSQSEQKPDGTWIYRS